MYQTVVHGNVFWICVDRTRKLNYKTTGSLFTVVSFRPVSLFSDQKWICEGLTVCSATFRNLTIVALKVTNMLDLGSMLGDRALKGAFAPKCIRIS